MLWDSMRMGLCRRPTQRRSRAFGGALVQSARSRGRSSSAQRSAARPPRCRCAEVGHPLAGEPASWRRRGFEPKRTSFSRIIESCAGGALLDRVPAVLQRVEFRRASVSFPARSSALALLRRKLGFELTESIPTRTPGPELPLQLGDTRRQRTMKNRVKGRLARDHQSAADRVEGGAAGVTTSLSPLRCEGGWLYFAMRSDGSSNPS